MWANTVSNDSEVFFSSHTTNNIFEYHESVGSLKRRSFERDVDNIMALTELQYLHYNRVISGYKITSDGK